MSTRKRKSLTNAEHQSEPTNAGGTAFEVDRSVQGMAAPPSIEEFIKERNEALISDDEKKIRAMFRKWGGGHEALPADPLTFWCAVHKARTAIPSLPMSYRRASKRWLVKRGFQSQDDGDIS